MGGKRKSLFRKKKSKNKTTVNSSTGQQKGNPTLNTPQKTQTPSSTLPPQTTAPSKTAPPQSTTTPTQTTQTPPSPSKTTTPQTPAPPKSKGKSSKGKIPPPPQSKAKNKKQAPTQNSSAVQRFAKVKQGFLPRIVQKIDPGDTRWTLSSGVRTAPGGEEKDDAELAESWIDTVGVDTAAEGLDSASSVLDYTGGGDKRTWNQVGESKYEGAWGDNDKQSEGVPIAGLIIRAAKLVVRAVNYVKQMHQFRKDNKDSSATSTGEKVGVAGQTLEMLLAGLDTALALVGTFHSALGRLPIVGAISGAISATVSLIMNAIQLSKIGRVSQRMKEQRELAKGTIRGKKELLEKSNVKFSEKKKKKRKLKFDLGKTTDKDIKDKKNKANGRERDRRLDEVTGELRKAKELNQDWNDDKDEALAALEDYDITNELTQAAHKRRKEGIINLITKDIVGIGTALAMIDPTALGGAIGSGLNAAIGFGLMIKKSRVTDRQRRRDKGKGGADINKSTRNKIRRRHHLAVLMYERLGKLKDYGIEEVEPDNATEEEKKQIEKGVGPYEVMEDRISAMGVAAPLYRAESASGMVDIMRRGFYRDSGV